MFFTKWLFCVNVRLERVPAVLKSAEKERVRISVWTIETLMKDEFLIRLSENTVYSNIRQQLKSICWSGAKEETLPFQPQLLLDCVSANDLLLPSSLSLSASLILIKLCGLWLLVSS